jgi:hypothetical protein
MTILEHKDSTDADRNARVLSDQVIVLGSENANVRPDHPIRLVVIKAKPHKSKGRYGGGSTGQDCDGFLRIVTNMLDVPAEIVALMYHYRWQIEIFFRYFKHLLGCRHLLSRSMKGSNCRSASRSSPACCLNRISALAATPQPRQFPAELAPIFRCHEAVPVDQLPAGGPAATAVPNRIGRVPVPDAELEHSHITNVVTLKRCDPTCRLTQKSSLQFVSGPATNCERTHGCQAQENSTTEASHNWSRCFHKKTF